jgi:hypothetical protein
MFASTAGAGARLGLRRLSTQRRNFPIQSVHMRFALRFERILELNLFLLELLQLAREHVDDPFFFRFVRIDQGLFSLQLVRRTRCREPTDG